MISARPNERTLMGKRHRIIKKPRDGAIEVTARQLDRFMDYRGGRLNSRDYKTLPNMILVNSPARDAIWALKQYDDETLLRVMDKSSLGRGKRVYIRVEREDKTHYYCSVSYIPRVLNNRDINDAIVRLYYVNEWAVSKKMLIPEPIDLEQCLFW